MENKFRTGCFWQNKFTVYPYILHDAWHRQSYSRGYQEQAEKKCRSCVWHASCMMQQPPFPPLLIKFLLKKKVCTIHKTMVNNKMKFKSAIVIWFFLRINLFEYMQVHLTNIKGLGYETIAKSCYSIYSLLA